MLDFNDMWPIGLIVADRHFSTVGFIQSDKVLYYFIIFIVLHKKIKKDDWINFF